MFPKYRELLRGENFLIQTPDEPELRSFHATRKVRAEGEHAAELAAVALIRTDSALQQITIRSDPPAPMIYAEEISPIAWWYRLGGRGYSFYPMADEEADGDLD
ncbi:MAG: hypothetical protein KDI71_20905 [Xanthomonadales bacterium]|nr:hypothetical protein [Xanthomonadales bacterium]